MLDLNCIVECKDCIHEDCIHVVNCFKDFGIPMVSFVFSHDPEQFTMFAWEALNGSPQKLHW